MLKIVRKTKKILAMIFLFITLFGSTQQIFAANQIISGEGQENFVARQYATRYKTTDSANNGEYGIIARRLIMKNAGWNFSAGDGILVFCAQNRSTFRYTEQHIQGIIISQRVLI